MEDSGPCLCDKVSRKKLILGTPLAMPFRHWGSGHIVVTWASTALVALIIGAWLYYAGYSKGDSVGQNTANSNAYARDAEQEIADRCMVLEPSGMAKCIREVIEATNEDRRAEDDLIAQREMGLWALTMAIVSLVTALIIAVGLYFIYRTLGYTRTAAEQTGGMLDEAKKTTAAAEASVREAEKATIAAQETASVSREIGEAQVRAYVSWANFKFTSHKDDTGTGLINWVLQFNVRNSGATPTRKTHIRTLFQIEHSNQPFIADLKDVQPDSLVIGAGEVIIASSYWVPGTELAAVKRGEKQFYFLCEVRYSNVVNPASDHITKIGFQSGEVTGDPTKAWSDDNRVDLGLLHIPGLNCTDEDCN